MPVLSKGGKVSLTYGDNRPRDARVVLASPNGRSLLLAFEGALRAPNGGYFVETIPLLQVEGSEEYEDLFAHGRATVERKP